MHKVPVNQARGAEIGEKLRRLMEEKGTNPLTVAKAIKLDSGYMYRMLDGKREWKLRYLEAILEHLGLSLEEFFGGEVEIPVVATISAKELFPYPQKIKKDAPLISYRGSSLPTIKNVYALEIKEDLLPVFTEGTVLICQKDTFDKIRNKALVVSHDERGMAQVYRVFYEDDTITLKGLDPAIPDRTLPRSFLKLCDLVIDIKPPMA